MFRFPAIAPFTIAALLAGGAQSLASPPVEAQERVILAMGTRLDIRSDGAGKAGFRAASEAAIVECARIESACSTWRADSAWSRLNASHGQPVRLSSEWIALLARACAWSHRTGGAFDPVLFQLLAAYGVREGGRTPSESEVMEARAASGVRRLHLVGAQRKATLERGAGIEEGGFVKGYALDRMKARLIQCGLHSGCLDFGGQLLAFGKAFQVSIANPKDRSLPRFTLLLNGASLATSALSERGRHIVDPRSGRLCEDWGSVSVLAATGLDADCLSTALYVMGPDEGMAWATRHHIPAIFLLNDGRVRMTPAFISLNPAPFSQEKP